jgi:phage I-like protein
LDGLRLKKQLEVNFKDGEKVKISPVGDVVGFDGRGFKIDGDLLISEIGVNDIHIPLDINHGFAEAVGWFDKNSFEVREDGIYASLELTTKGKELIETKAYRYMSPVYMMGENWKVMALDSVGLVNRPNLLNRELNEKNKTKKEQKLEELEKLRTDVESLRTEIKELKEVKKEAPDEEMKTELNSLKTAMVAMNEKLTVFGKTNLEKNDKTLSLNDADKKMAKMLGISEDDFLKAKGE